MCLKFSELCLRVLKRKIIDKGEKNNNRKVFSIEKKYFCKGVGVDVP